MAAFSGIANTFLVITLSVALSACAPEMNPTDNNGEQQSSSASEALITANPEAALTQNKVDVGTIPAPVIPSPEPLVETTPEPVTPPVKAAVPAPAPASPKPAAPPAPEPLPVPAPAPVGNHAWINATMAKYGVYPEAGTKFVIGPMPAGCSGADGCTEYSYYPDTGVAFDYTITLRPGQLTEYLLFHEIGHARGIRDECGADNFARSVLGPVPGHYC